VAFLRLASLIVNFFSNKQQQAPVASLVIPFNALDVYIMVGDDDSLQVSFEGGLSDVLMASAAVGIASMHMQVGDDLWHFSSSGGFDDSWYGRYNPPALEQAVSHHVLED